MSRLASLLTALALVVVGLVATAPSANAAIGIRTSCAGFSGTVIAKGRLPIANVGLSQSTYLVKRNAARSTACVQVHNATPRKGYIVLARQYYTTCGKDGWRSESKNFGYRSDAAITFPVNAQKNVALAQVVYPATKRTALKRTSISPTSIIGCTG